MMGMRSRRRRVCSGLRCSEAGVGVPGGLGVPGLGGVPAGLPSAAPPPAPVLPTSLSWQAQLALALVLALALALLHWAPSASSSFNPTATASSGCTMTVGSVDGSGPLSQTLPLLSDAALALLP